jgi:hypothetical protein
MLSATDIRGTQRRRRTPYSDKQHYQEYILQRIEGFKNSIGREELMRLGDEAASELQATSEGQFVLTEVLMLETVDRLIMKRLALRPYRRWREQFRKLREAQRTPVHWGLDSGCALARLLPRIEAHDIALVIGAGAEPTTYLLAAHDAAVTFVACDVGCVERVESRMAAEALASLFEGFVAPLAPALPCFLEALDQVDVVVIDPDTLAGFAPRPARRFWPISSSEAGRAACTSSWVEAEGSRPIRSVHCTTDGPSRKSPCVAGDLRRHGGPTGCSSPSPRVPRTRRLVRSPRPSDTSHSHQQQSNFRFQKALVPSTAGACGLPSSGETLSWLSRPVRTLP